MDFGLTDKQEMLHTTAREFVADAFPPERAKEIVATVSGGTGQIQRNGIARMGLRTYTNPPPN